MHKQVESIRSIKFLHCSTLSSSERTNGAPGTRPVILGTLLFKKSPSAEGRVMLSANPFPIVCMDSFISFS